MAQNRKPPAYQEYAATILADRNFRLMTLAKRGLFYTMRLECWQNSTVPVNTEELAKYLGFDASDIENLLTEEVKAFFEAKGSDYICPEIEDYRQHLNEQRKKQSEGGKKGAQSTNSRYKKQSGDSQATRQDTRESLVESSLDKLNKNQPLEHDDTNYEWIRDYDASSDE